MQESAEQSANSVAVFWVERGIMRVRFKPGALVDLESAKDCVRLRLSLQNGQPMPLLLDIVGLKEMTKTAREFLSTDKGEEGTTAGVLLANESSFVRTLANIYFRLAMPKIPHRMFSDANQAMEWLSQFRKTESKL